MTVYPAQTGTPPRGLPASDEIDAAGDQPAPARRRGIALVIAFLVLLSLTVLCVTAFLVVRVFAPGSLSVLPGTGEWSALLPGAGDLVSAVPASSTPSGRARIAISPEQGTTNTLITVSGVGWLPGEPVFVFLRSSDDPQGSSYSYAAAVVDSSGSFHTAFTFPSETRWVGKSSADVIAQGTRSGWQASRRFTLLAPTPTSTLPPTIPPTVEATATPQPTETPLPTATSTQVVTTDWRGEYYANPSLDGIPVLVRNDLAVSFDWGPGSPAAGLSPDQFSARWIRQLAFAAGLYRFTAGVDDGVRVWIDGQLLQDQWRDGPFRSSSFDLELSRGEHLLVVEYYEAYGDARVLFDWVQVEPPTITPAPTPTSTLSPTPEPTAVPTPEPTATPSPVGDWLGEYYDNPELWGDPVLLRPDPELIFDWGSGSPDPQLPEDHFSARWTRQAWYAGGTYRLSVDVDDGVRVWVDGQPVLDEWHPSGGTYYFLNVSLAEGLRDFRVEYFEDADTARIRFEIRIVPGSP